MWRKSSTSRVNACVEVRRDLAALRDSKQAGGAALPVRALPAFIEVVKAGGFDR